MCFTCIWSQFVDTSFHSSQDPQQSPCRTSPASYPDVSLLMKMFAQRKAGRRQRASPAVCTLPMVPCGSSPVTRFALASAMRKTKRLRRRLALRSFQKTRGVKLINPPGAGTSPHLFVHEVRQIWGQ